MKAVQYILALAMTTFSIASAQTIDLPGDSLFPEGIAAHNGTGDLFVGSVAGRSILRISDGIVTRFKNPGEDGLANVIGLAVDEARNRLWVASTHFIVDGAMNMSPDLLPTAFVFDTRDGTLLGKYDIPNDGRPHFLNDVDVDSEGNALFTDSFAPIIWRISSELTGIEKWVESGEFNVQQGFNLNGIAVSPDGNTVAVSIPGPTAALFLVDTESREVTRLQADPGFRSGDGITFLDDDTLIATVMGVWKLSLDRDGRRVVQEAIPATGLDFPTTSALLGDTLWVVNSQLDHWVPMFNNSAPPQLPFTITAVAIQ